MVGKGEGGGVERGSETDFEDFEVGAAHDYGLRGVVGAGGGIVCMMSGLLRLELLCPEHGRHRSERRKNE